MKDWYGQAFGDGAAAVPSDELDPWQKFNMILLLDRRVYHT